MADQWHGTARALLAAGMPVNSRDGSGPTALHWASWKGYADLVKLLLDHGASLTIEEAGFQGAPADWFEHGLRNCKEEGGDHPEVARLLLVAGVTFSPGNLPTCNAAVDAVFREHGLIAAW
jgi:hypothetical protein